MPQHPTPDYSPLRSEAPVHDTYVRYLFGRSGTGLLLHNSSSLSSRDARRDRVWATRFVLTYTNISIIFTYTSLVLQQHREADRTQSVSSIAYPPDGRHILSKAYNDMILFESGILSAIL